MAFFGSNQQEAIDHKEKEEDTVAQKAKEEKPVEKISQAKVEKEAVAPVEKKVVVEKVEEKIVPPKKSWTERLYQGLSKSRSDVWDKASSLFKTSKNNEQIEDLETIF